MTRLPRLRRLLQRDGRRRRARTATAVTLATASLAATVTAGTASAAEPSQMLVGMFDGTGHTAADTRAVSGTTPATALLFSNFSDRSINDVPSALSRAWNDGSVPVLTLEFDTDGNPNAGARGGGGGAQRDSAAVDTAIAHGRGWTRASTASPGRSAGSSPATTAAPAPPTTARSTSAPAPPTTARSTSAPATR
ncbi:hypothetical protein [Corynebacterium bovis]|uniref:hypothetical protein n=1 Tax=Corynebacterium bovis TaxID=36808 RepID=UPI0021AB1CFC|nr:hypothetical protein [Corynebacterium bovis]